MPASVNRATPKKLTRFPTTLLLDPFVRFAGFRFEIEISFMPQLGNDYLIAML